MKRNFVFLSVVALLALGGLCLLLLRQLAAARERARAAAAAAEAEAVARATREERLSEVERERARVEKQNAELADLAHNLRQSEAQQASNVTALVKQLKATGTNPAGASSAGRAEEAVGGKGMGDMLRKMMQDPAMKEMIRSQQKATMKTMYGSLFKDLNLSADQQKQLTDILLDSQMNSVENAAGVLEGEGAGKTNAINALVEKHKATTEQIKNLLGDEKYAQYEDYQKTMADRMTLNQFQQQAAGTETALRDDQLKQLVQLMKEERTKVPPVVGEDPAKAAESLSNLMDEETLNRQLKWQEDFNQRVLDRAGQILTPEQLKEYADFQAQQLNMQKFGLKMARDVFGAGKKGGVGQPDPSVPASPPVK